MALTANALKGAREFYLEQGFDEFLSKPFQPDDLEQMILDSLPKDKIVKDISHELESMIKEMESQNQDSIKLDNIKGIHWEEGSSHFRNMEAYMDTMEEFYLAMTYEADKLMKFYDELNQKLTQDIKSKDELEKESIYKPYRVQIHSMKSSANLIGANELGELAKQLENAAKEYAFDFIQKEHENFLQEWKSYKERLNSIFQTDVQENKISFEPDKIIEQLKQLKIAFMDMDIEKMDTIIDTIKMYSYPKEMQEDIQRLMAFVTDLEEEAGIELINNLIQRMDR